MRALARTPSGPEAKQPRGSFSFIEPPSTRFLAELSLRPAPADPAPLQVAPDAGLIFPSASSSSPAVPAQPQAAVGSPMQPNAARAKPGLRATPPIAISAVSDRVDAAQGDRRGTTRSRRRLTASLGSLLAGAKRDKQDPTADESSSASQGTGATNGRAAPLAALEGLVVRSRRSSSASCRPTVEERAVAALRPATASPTHPSSSPPPGGRNSLDVQRGPRRPSLDELARLQRASDSSEGSFGAMTATGSAVSTAPTSPDARAWSEDEGSTQAETRRRRSLALAKQLSQDGRDDDVEDLSDFVVASGSYSTSPATSNGPFTRRPSNAASPAMMSSTSSELYAPSPRVVVNTSGNSAAPVHPRRLTRNIEGLSLGDLGRRASTPASPPTNLPSQTAAPFAVTSSSPQPQSSSSPPAPTRNSSSRINLGALPRLLSSNTIPTAGTVGDEHDQDGETDTDAEDQSDEEDDEDEGETYATSDEGPVTTRSAFATPAQTPAASVFATPSTRTPGSPPPTVRMPSLTRLTMSPAVGGSANWVSFASTPTPSTVRTARPHNGMSYFDLPRPVSSSSTAAAAGSNAPPKTPLALMSMSDVVRGKRPALQEDVDAAATPASSSTAKPSERIAPPQTPDNAACAGLYRLRSQSVIALASPSMVNDDGEPVGTAGVTGLDSVWQTGVPSGQRTPGFLNFGFAAQRQQEDDDQRAVPQTPGQPKTPAPLDVSTSVSPSSTQPSSPTTARPRPTTTASPGNRLQRTRSMYELRDAPPAYSSMYRQSGTGAPQVILPREEEGREGLPGYSCSIHIEGYMPRKLEFTAPGVQARDRAWKRQYFVLHGTSIKIFKYDLKTHPLPGEVDWSVIPADIAGRDGPPPLHFHEGEYGVDQSAGGHRFSIEVAKAKAKDRIIASATAAADNAVVRHYSLQNAESGLAADYLKRKHVVRVRAEGEQFLLQAKDDRGVIDLIEALQAATNVALDLDARPLPKFITLPRRRRRRRARPADPNAPNAAAGAAAGTAAATNGAAAPASGASEDRMGDMLAEEQNAYSRRTGGTVM